MLYNIIRQIDINLIESKNLLIYYSNLNRWINKVPNLGIW